MASIPSLRIKEKWNRRLLERVRSNPTADIDLDTLAEAMVDWAKPLQQPARYKCLYGGRGSGKSYAVADTLLIEGSRRCIRVLCGREFQVSIKDSVHHLLKRRINELGLSDFYTVQEATILGPHGTQFIFKGIRHNISSIKSMSGITHCWIEEAQTISQESWEVLVPTIREEGSEIWVTFNPHQDSDPIYQLFVEKPRPNSYIERVNWDRNPHFPTVLDEERRLMAATDPDLYAHIWEGECIKNSEAQVLFGKWVVDEFTPGSDWDGPYHGGDWGFGTDPSAAVRLWVHGRKLYVEYESYAYRLELDDTAKRWRQDIPGIEGYVVRADSSRPDSISHVRRHGIPQLQGAKKGPNSVAEGIAHLRSYEKIIVHPRCKNFAQECRLYSHKVDRLTGDVLPDIIDKYNHLIDSARYALEPLMKPIAQRRQAQARSNW